MNSSIKNAVGVVVIFVFAAIGYSVAMYVKAYSSFTDSQSMNIRQFSGIGQGDIYVTPDIAEITVGVLSEGGVNIQDTQIENSKKMNAVVDYVKLKGVEAKDVKTLGYNIYPRYQYIPCPSDGGACPPPKITGYTVSQDVLVKMRDFAKISEIIEGVTASGANSVSQFTFTVEDPSKYEQQARLMAVEKAKQNAVDMASGAGIKIGRVISVYTYVNQPFFDGKGGGGMAMSETREVAAETPVVEPGQSRIKVEATVVYQIID